LSWHNLFELDKAFFVNQEGLQYFCFQLRNQFELPLMLIQLKQELAFLQLHLQLEFERQSD
jgi:hypothetical protein